MNKNITILGKIAQVTGLAKYIETYREGVKAPEREKKLLSMIYDLRDDLELVNGDPRKKFDTKPHQHPSILFNTMPKTGSVFIGKTLARSLDIFYSERPLSHGFFPYYFVIDNEARWLKKKNIIRQEHINGSEINLMLIKRYIDKMVVHFRDPRQATLSWFHHTDRLRKKFPNGVNYSIHQEPSNYNTWNLSQRLDWHIETTLASNVKWLRDWIVVCENNVDLKILFTSYEDFFSNPKEFFNNILEFYEIDKKYFSYNPPRKVIGNNYRNGTPDEWKNVLTDAQKSRSLEIIGIDLIKKFSWDKY